MPVSNLRRSLVITELIHLLFPLQKDNEVRLIYNVGHLILPGVLLSPDLAFVRTARLPGDVETYIPVGPDIAIEVLRRTDVTEQVREKVELYLVSGASAVWVVQPEVARVHIYTASGTQTLAHDDILGGGDIVPTLSIPISKIFRH
jgi:Uma2 family endonuclease